MPHEPRKRILICDGDRIYSQALRLVLTAAGYDSLRIREGDKAMEFLDLDPDFNLIIADIPLPGADGFQLLKAIRSGHTTRHIPFVFLTGIAAWNSIDRARELDCSDYFIKASTDLSKVLQLVEKYTF